MDQRLKNLRRHNHLAAWTAEVQACRSSGLTVTQWCLEHGIRPSTYFHHQKLVLQAMRSQTEFYEVPLTKDSWEATIRVEINGLFAEIHNGAEENTILSVVRAMKSC